MKALEVLDRLVCGIRTSNKKTRMCHRHCAMEIKLEFSVKHMPTLKLCAQVIYPHSTIKSQVTTNVPSDWRNKQGMHALSCSNKVCCQIVARA